MLVFYAPLPPALDNALKRVGYLPDLQDHDLTP